MQDYWYVGDDFVFGECGQYEDIQCQEIVDYDFFLFEWCGFCIIWLFVNVCEFVVLSVGIELMVLCQVLLDIVDVELMNSFVMLMIDNVFVDEVGECSVLVMLDVFLVQVEWWVFCMVELQLGYCEDVFDVVQDVMLWLVWYYCDKLVGEWNLLFWGILCWCIVDLQWWCKVCFIVVGWFGGGCDGDGDELLMWELVDIGFGLQDWLQDVQLWCDMFVVVKNLLQCQCEVFMLCVFEGLDVVEIVCVMGCFEGSVKIYLLCVMYYLCD